MGPGHSAQRAPQSSVQVSEAVGPKCAALKACSSGVKGRNSPGAPAASSGSASACSPSAASRSAVAQNVDDRHV